MNRLIKRYRDAARTAAQSDKPVYLCNARTCKAKATRDGFCKKHRNPDAVAALEKRIAKAKAKKAKQAAKSRPGVSARSRTSPQGRVRFWRGS
jgi:hypothetical protein